MSEEKNLPVSEEEKGATMVEYALMVALLAVALIAAVTALKTSASKAFSQTGSTMAKAG